jgi:hypothetical protein
MENEKIELNEEQMEKVSGGKNEGGYMRRPPERDGCVIYQVKPGETLERIARANGTTVQKIMRVNKELKNENFLTPRAFIYIPI